MMRFAGRLLVAALVAASFSMLATILYLVIDNPCDCENPSDDCGLFYVLIPAVFVPIGFFLFLAPWAVALNARLTLRSRVVCGLVVSALMLAGVAGLAFYSEAHPNPKTYDC
jgi:uncharacterized BrkB/YihY/UPF0761 family membrane protein